MRNSPPRSRSRSKAFRRLPAIEPLAPKDRAALERFASVIGAAQSFLGPRAPVRLIQTLLDVGMHPDTTRCETAERVDMPDTTASQDLRTLSVELRDGSPGLGLVEARWDASDIRLLRYRTTPRGDLAAAQLNSALLA